MTSFVTYPASKARSHSVLKVLTGVGIGILSGISKTVSGNHTPCNYSQSVTDNFDQDYQPSSRIL
jgi:hypothetical protein